MDNNSPLEVNKEIDKLLIKKCILKSEGLFYESYVLQVHIQNLREAIAEYAAEWKSKYEDLKAEYEALKEELALRRKQVDAALSTYSNKEVDNEK